jgi:hypothetical protein
MVTSGGREGPFLPQILPHGEASSIVTDLRFRLTLAAGCCNMMAGCLTSDTGAEYSPRHVCRACTAHESRSKVLAPSRHDGELKETAGFASLRGDFGGCTGTVTVASDHARF